MFIIYIYKSYYMYVYIIYVRICVYIYTPHTSYIIHTCQVSLKLGFPWNLMEVSFLVSSNALQQSFSS